MLTLASFQSSFTPFLAENIYQSLRTFFRNEEALKLGGDLRSVHFLSFPEVRQEYFDPVIQRQVTRMQAVIELARVLRDKNKITLKVGYCRWLRRGLQS